MAVPTRSSRQGTSSLRRSGFSEAQQSYSEEGLAQSRLWPPGTVCVTIAANIAESAMLRIEACFPDSVIGVIAIEGVADSSYLKYAMDFMKLRLQAVSGGTTQDNLSLEKLLRFEFPAPPLELQARISKLLRAFDDLIDSNRRRIEILEEMARLLYREWFVQYRFPGHEDVEMGDSELGPVPKDWTVGTLHQLGTVTIGGDWGKDEPAGLNTVRVACLRGVDLPRLQRGDPNGVRFRWVKETSLEKRRLGEGDVVVEGSGECGRSLAYRSSIETLVKAPVIYSNFCKRISFEDLATAVFVARTFNEMCADGRMDAFKTGTTIPNLNFKALTGSHRLVLPSTRVLQQFHESTNPGDRFALLGMNVVLTEARDLLLPRLVSGELDVSELDLDLEAVS